MVPLIGGRGCGCAWPRSGPRTSTTTGSLTGRCSGCCTSRASCPSALVTTPRSPPQRCLARGTENRDY
eukprot:190879-Pyramimonas_sp.AAC.3